MSIETPLAVQIKRPAISLLIAWLCTSLASVAAAAESSPLVPAGEVARMSKHPVKLDSLQFVPGKGLSATSTDGNFKLTLGVRAQYRISIARPNAPGLESTISSQLRRVRLTSTGHFFSPNVKYKMELAVSPRDVSQRDSVVRTSPLLDFYVDWKTHRDLSFRVGQYKVPFNRQRVISSGSLLMVDRAITNSEFNLDRDVGFDIRSHDFLGLGLLRYHLGIYAGSGRNSYDNDDFGLFYLARLEVTPLGSFASYDEVDWARTAPRLSLGIAHAYIDDAKLNRGIRGSEPADGGTSDFNVTTGDIMFKAYGLSVQAEGFYRRVNRKGGAALDDNGNRLAPSPGRDGVGLLVQAGYLVPRLPIVVAARFAEVRGQDNLGSNGLSNTREVGVGLGYFFARHRLKFQADLERVGDLDNFSKATDEFLVQMQAAF